MLLCEKVTPNGGFVQPGAASVRLRGIAEHVYCETVNSRQPHGYISFLDHQWLAFPERSR